MHSKIPSRSIELIRPPATRGLQPKAAVPRDQSMWLRANQDLFEAVQKSQHFSMRSFFSLFPYSLTVALAFLDHIGSWKSQKLCFLPQPKTASQWQGTDMPSAPPNSKSPAHPEVAAETPQNSCPARAAQAWTKRRSRSSVADRSIQFHI